MTNPISSLFRCQFPGCCDNRRANLIRMKCVADQWRTVSVPTRATLACSECMQQEANEADHFTVRLPNGKTLRVEWEERQMFYGLGQIEGPIRLYSDTPLITCNSSEADVSIRYFDLNDEIRSAIERESSRLITESGPFRDDVLAAIVANQIHYGDRTDWFEILEITSEIPEGDNYQFAICKLYNFAPDITDRPGPKGNDGQEHAAQAQVDSWSTL